MKLPKPLKNLRIFWVNTDFYAPKYSAIILFISLIALFFVYDFDKISFLRPQSVHQWRQCDCLSFVQQYYQSDNSFWEPKIHYLGEDGSGKTVSDFPVIYYTIAQIWKLTGTHEFIFRWFNLLLSFTGLFFLHRTVEKILKNSFWGLIISLLLFSSTIYVYYSNNFLMNVPAMAIALVALYFFYEYTQKKKSFFLVISIALYTLAALLKIQALTSFMAILGIFLLQKFFPKEERNFIVHPTNFAILSILLFTTLFSWYLFAHFYNEAHNKGIFLIGVLPIWEYTQEQILHVISYVRILWLESYQSITIQLLAIFSFFAAVVYRKHLHPYFFQFLIFLAIGFVLYLILWFQVFDNHDYYLINQLLLMKVSFVAGLVVLKNRFPKIFTSSALKILALILLSYNISVCRENIQVRYNGWPNEKHLKYYKALERIDNNSVLNQIPKNEKILVLDDPSFNISLYFLNRPGYTNAIGKLKDSAEIAQKIKEGYHFLLINDSAVLRKDYIKPFIQNKIGQHSHINLYYLK